MKDVYRNYCITKPWVLSILALFCFPISIYAAYRKKLINLFLSILMLVSLSGLFAINLSEIHDKPKEIWLFVGGLPFMFYFGVNKPRKIKWFSFSINKALLLFAQILLISAMFIYFWIFLPFSLPLFFNILDSFQIINLETAVKENPMDITHYFYYFFAIIWFASVIYSYFDLFWKKNGMYQ